MGYKMRSDYKIQTESLGRPPLPKSRAPQRKRSLRLAVTPPRFGTVARKAPSLPRSKPKYKYVERAGVVDVYEVRGPSSSPYDISYDVRTSGVGAHILEGTGIQIVI